MTKTVAIVQARMGSNRLPGKVMADIKGKPAITHVLTRVGKARRVDELWLACSDLSENDPLAATAAQLDIPVFRGDENDVLSRYVQVAAETRADAIVRITADCPMIDPELIDAAIEMYETGDWDYVANGHIRSYPDGLDVEVFSAAALWEADLKAQHAFLREHVTPYIRGSHPQYGAGEFRIGNLICPQNFGHVRWTLDTANDLEVIRALVARLPDDYRWMDALAVATEFPILLGTANTKLSIEELHQVTGDD